jgi:hypothetical protein
VSPRVVIVGGGAAGFFAAITCAEANPAAEVTLLEKSRSFLGKVRISGGGRCNVTHALFDPREFAARYPRGERELIGLLARFSAADTVHWFARRGVALKTEADGRMFPVTDSSQTIVDCLVASARAAGVKLRSGCGVREIRPGFQVVCVTGETMVCDRVLLATGGCRTVAGGELAVRLGHMLEPPVPSLFTFHVAGPWWRELAGIAVDPVEVRAVGLRERGAMLITHAGVSGPVVLRLSAWGARAMNAVGYRFPLWIHWLPDHDLPGWMGQQRRAHGAKLVVNTPLLPARLWERLVDAPQLRWAQVTRAEQQRLVERLTRWEVAVTGQSPNQEEFVTCGGVRLREVNFQTMESRVCPGLFFAGELLDVDGITGGFNFQAAWTTGWVAGRALAASLPGRGGGC